MQDQNSYILKACKVLNTTKKDLSKKLDVTYKTIDNWANDENSIPVKQKIVIELMVENVALKKDLNYQKSINTKFVQEFFVKEKVLRNLVDEFTCNILKDNK